MATTLIGHRPVMDMPRLTKKPTLLPWEQILRGVHFLAFPPTWNWAPIVTLPRARRFSEAFEMFGKLWIVGGYYEDGSCADIEIFDPVTSTWSQIANPFTFWGQAFAVSQGTIYAIAGNQACWTMTETVEQYDPATGVLTPKPPLPNPCILPGVASTSDGRIYVMGGCTPPSAPNGGGPPDAYFDHVQIYDPATNAWAQGTPMPVTRDQFALVTVNDKIYTFGGFDTANLYNRTDVYDPATDTWQQLADMPTARRCFGATVDAQGFIYAIGGLIGDQGSAIVEVFDPATNSWTTNTPLNTGRWSHGLATVDNRIYVAGGLIRVGRTRTATRTYSRSSRSKWRCSRAPTARRYDAGWVRRRIFPVVPSVST